MLQVDHIESDGQHTRGTMATKTVSLLSLFALCRNPNLCFCLVLLMFQLNRGHFPAKIVRREKFSQFGFVFGFESVFCASGRDGHVVT